MLSDACDMQVRNLRPTDVQLETGIEALLVKSWLQSNLAITDVQNPPSPSVIARLPL